MVCPNKIPSMPKTNPDTDPSVLRSSAGTHKSTGATAGKHKRLHLHFHTIWSLLKLWLWKPAPSDEPSRKSTSFPTVCFILLIPRSDCNLTPNYTGSDTACRAPHLYLDPASHHTPQHDGSHRKWKIIRTRHSHTRLTPASGPQLINLAGQSKLRVPNRLCSCTQDVGIEPGFELDRRSMTQTKVTAIF